MPKKQPKKQPKIEPADEPESANGAVPQPDAAPDAAPDPKTDAKPKRKSRAKRNGRALVIVESPAKAKTINKILGPSYVVKACYGHVRDLPKRAFGVDVEHDFEPTYTAIRGKSQVIKDLKALVKSARAIYLAPDPDREGEAIAWHLVQALRIPPERTKRVTFNEITKKGVLEAFEKPHDIVMDRVYAQQARRLLDRIVGYKLSPVLWEKIARGLSAGRVQSVAVRLIVERENEIRVFKPQEYWTVTAHVSKLKEPTRFRAELSKLDDKEAQVTSGTQSSSLVEELNGAKWTITDVEQKERQEHPSAPFTTSTLQQAASIKLRYSAKRTMIIAQQLYEGVEIGEEGSVGLITYMRTDSFRVADEAVAEVRGFIDRTYGKEYLPEKPPVRAARKGAQEAHEAIRPTSSERTPEVMKPYLSEEQNRMYLLIWRRFVASQMKPAVYSMTEGTIHAGRATFMARGRQLKFDGFTKLTSPWAKLEDVVAMFKEHGSVELVLAQLKRGGLRLTPEAADELRARVGPDTPPEASHALAQVRDQVLPALESGETLKLHKVDPAQHFTEPPPRYSEASLVKALEKFGIGRPSTYAPIISTIQDRGYVAQDDRRLKPTELGELVTEKLVHHFTAIMDTGFTAEMEEKLDLIEDGQTNWVDVLRKFYGAFIGDLDKARETMESVKSVEAVPLVPCEKCTKPMLIKWNRFGKFLACSAYPACKSTKSLQAPEIAGEKCQKCGADMVMKSGRFGRFIACSKYPECKNTRPIPRGNRKLVIPQGWAETCEKCGKPMDVKYGRRGPFIACTGYPDCKNTARVPKEWFQSSKPADGAAPEAEPEAGEGDAE